MVRTEGRYAQSGQVDIFDMNIVCILHKELASQFTFRILQLPSFRPMQVLLVLVTPLGLLLCTT